MRESLKEESRWGLLLSLFVLGLITALIVLPYQFRSEAGSQGKKQGLFPQTTSQEEGIDDYDIRLDKGAADKLVKFRQAAAKGAVTLADMREQFVRAEESLRTRVKSLKVDYNEHLRVPEVIGPNVLEGMNYMTGPSAAKRSAILRGFAKENNELIGMTDSQIDQLKTTADYTNPDGNASWVVLEQYIGEIPMFRGELKAGFTKDGRMVRAISGLAPGLEYESLSRDFGDPLNAVRSAASHIEHELRQSDVTRNGARSTELNVVYGEGPYATTARKYYFPTEAGVARAAWLVTIWKDISAYEVMVDAETGTLLWRHNMVKDQTQPVTYTVWANTTSPMFSLDSPAPFTPGTIDPSDPTQGPLQPRISVTLIGNEAPYTFNNLGWMNDNTNALEGNNVQAGLDRDTIQGPDLPLITGSGTRVFNFASNPPPGNPPPGDDPLPPGDTPTPCDPAPPPVIDSQRAAVTQMFYVVNRFHDVLYLGGFTEQARNFQLDNFGRGGTGNDRIIAEGQDCIGTNGASMSSSSTDGTPARMLMLIFTTPTQDRDSILDAEVMLHEIGHGVTNRLHTLGIGGTQGAQMHEGNGDFLAHLLLSETTDPADGTGTYPMGGYLILFSGTSNYYYGLRRYPRAVIAFRGGPGNLPHNPLTYADIDPAQFNPGGGAFPPRFTGSATGGHDGGEIWSGMLWEVRARLIQRLGHTAGTSKMLQIMLDGMKLAPANVRMLTQRDAILISPSITDADRADIWAGFAARGMGFNASNPTGNTVVESFDVPNAVVTAPITVSDSTGDNDGFPEPGENILVSVPVTNSSGSTVNNVVVSIAGGGSVNYGSIANGATVTNNIPYTVPGACGGLHTIQINLTSAIGTNPPRQHSFRIGVPVEPPVTFTNAAAITINDAAPASPYPSNITASGLTGNKIIKLRLNGLSHTFVSDIDMLLVGPGGQKYVVLSDLGGSGPGASNVTLTLHDEATNAFPTTPPPTGEYRPGNSDTTTDVFPAPAPATPYDNPAPAGTATFASVFGGSGSAMNGTWSLYIVDDGGGDVGQLAGGWSLIFESNDYICCVCARRARADFDADGRTDISVWRPSDGNWHISQSTDGYAAYTWGASGDRIVPGDFDGDGKADVAVWRPSTGAWYILNSNGGTYSTYTWGASGDVPVVGDYDDDGKADVAVYRPPNASWHILRSSDGGYTHVTWAVMGDVPVAGDFDGDGQTDIAVRRPLSGGWFIRRSTGGVILVTWGVGTDIPVHADYDGDQKDDVAVWRPSTGGWFILRSSDGGYTQATWGATGDVPVPGDYDGDGRADIAVVRNGVWHISQSTDGYRTATWGVGTDVAIPGRY